MINILVSIYCSIGLAIARRLAQEGAKVMVSSRRQENVDRAVELLRSEPGDLVVEGVVCHVGKPEHRRNLIEKVELELARKQKSIISYLRQYQHLDL